MGSIRFLKNVFENYLLTNTVSVTWSFINQSNMLIWCLRNMSLLSPLINLSFWLNKCIKFYLLTPNFWMVNSITKHWSSHLMAKKCPYILSAIKHLHHSKPFRDCCFFSAGNFCGFSTTVTDKFLLLLQSIISYSIDNHAI